jgi:hypothetical protein
MREQLLQLLRQRPFVPVRLHLSNGIVHEIRHPELAMVSPSYIVVGVPAGDAGGPAIIESVIVSLLHLVQAEQMTNASPHASN